MSPVRSRRPPTPAALALGTFLTAAAALSWGCTGEGSDGAADPFAAEAWSLGPPEVRIGSVDDPDYAFSAVSDLATGPDGSIFSLHRSEATVRRWTADGRPQGTVGGEGEGPGEFQRPAALGFFGDTLWVFDTDAYRVTLFDMEGELLGTLTPRVDLGGGGSGDRWASPPRPRRPLRDGSLYGVSPGWSDAIARGNLPHAPHVHMGADGSVLDTIWVRQYRPTDVLALLRENGGTFTSQPFGDEPVTSLDASDRLVVLDRRAHEGEGPADFRVTALEADGDTAFHAVLPYEPVPLPPARVDSVVRARAEGLHDFMTQREPGLALADLVRDLREATYVPEHLPPIATMVMGRDGSIWLRRFEPVEGVEGSMAEWWVLDGSGAPVGRVLTPPDLRLVDVTTEAVLGVETDDLEVQYIVRHPIRGRGAT